jgi:hypothetical protein
MRRGGQGNSLYRGSSGDRQDTGSPHEERRTTTATGTTASYASSARFRLVCIALGFHTSPSARQQTSNYDANANGAANSIVTYTYEFAHIPSS